MKIDSLNRRAFLRGLHGAVLAIPFIPSLTRAAPSTPPIRFVHLTHGNGAYAPDFFPSDAGMAKIAEDIYAKPLANAGATISAGANLARSDERAVNLGEGFDSYRGLLTVLRGLDLQVDISKVSLLHGKWVSSTASHDADGTFGWSIDMVLEKSGKYYASVPAVGGLRIGLGERQSIYDGEDQPFITDARQAFERVFGVCGGEQAPSAAEGIARRKLLLVDRVYEDYRRHREARFLSGEGKQQLESYMSLVRDLEERLNVVTNQYDALTCDDVAAPPVDNGELNDLYNRITVAALAAGNTQIVTQRVNGYKDGSLSFDHSGVHAKTNNWRRQKDWQYNVHFKSLLDQMHAFEEANGKSLLENSIVFNVPNMGDSDHRVNDLAVVVAGGGANGKLRMGQYIDYRRRKADGTFELGVRGGAIGRPYNEFLVTLFNAFGLEKADYERGGQTGFGSYKYPDLYGHYYGNKNVPLPYFYTG